MNKFCLTLIIFFFYFKITLASVKVNSIIRLDNNIPEEDKDTELVYYVDESVEPLQPVETDVTKKYDRESLNYYC